MVYTMSKLPRRIVKETERLLKEKVPGISAAPYADNPRYFSVTIDGPDETPYAGGLFQLEMFLPSDYPMVSNIEYNIGVSVYLIFVKIPLMQ